MPDGVSATDARLSAPDGMETDVPVRLSSEEDSVILDIPAGIDALALVTVRAEVSAVPQWRLRESVPRR